MARRRRGTVFRMENGAEMIFPSEKSRRLADLVTARRRVYDLHTWRFNYLPTVRVQLLHTAVRRDPARARARRNLVILAAAGTRLNVKETRARERVGAQTRFVIQRFPVHDAR